MTDADFDEVKQGFQPLKMIKNDIELPVKEHDATIKHVDLIIKKAQ